MIGRDTVPTELESILGQAPFERHAIYRGTKVSRGANIFGRLIQPTVKKVGYFKGLGGQTVADRVGGEVVD